MPERLILTPLEAHITLLNEVFTQPGNVNPAFNRGHYNEAIAKALHGRYWHDWFHPDNHPITPEQFLDDTKSQLLMDTVDRVLGNMYERVRIPVVLHFGLEDGKIWTFNEIGNKYGYEKQIIHRIVRRSLRLLRHPSRSDHFKQFLPENNV